MSKSNAAIVMEFQQKAKASAATLEAQRDTLCKALDRGDYLSEIDVMNLTLAEEIHLRYRELTDTRADARPMDDATAARMIQALREARAALIDKLITKPESMWTGFGAVRQYQAREAARQFLRETEFIEGEK